MHSDAVQAAGRVPLDVDGWGVDLCSVSAHKLGGPQGVGALFIRSGHEHAPLITGGGQEQGRRSGTSNVAGIVGFGVAAREAMAAMGAGAARMEALRDGFEAEVLTRISDVRVLGDTDSRLPNTSLLSVRGVKGEALVFELDAHGIAISTGSACSSGSGELSHVLRAMALPEPDLDAAVRISIGHGTDEPELARALSVLAHAVERLRRLAGASRV